MIIEPRDVGKHIIKAPIWEGLSLPEFVHSLSLAHKKEGVPESAIIKMKLYVPLWLYELFGLCSVPMEISGFELEMNQDDGLDSMRIVLR